jgi:predicted nucleic acid-binding protein
MRAVVLDASAIASFVLDARSTPTVTEIIGDEECEVFIPHLCDLEVASALRKATLRGVLSPSRAAEALDLYAGLPLHRLDHMPLLRRVFGLRDNFSVYDAAYVALAEAVEAPLITADERLCRAIRDHTDVEAVTSRHFSRIIAMPA